MDLIKEKIDKIYKEQQLAMYVRDYTETDNENVKDDLLIKIQILITELNL